MRQVNFFFTFLNLASIGFTTEHDWTKLSECPFLVIFGPGTSFLVGQEVGGEDQNFFGLKTSGR